MKLKLVSLIFLMIILAGTAYAGDDTGYLDESKTVTFQGIDFKMPHGFSESKSPESYDELGSEGQTCFYVNDEGGEIAITVISDWMGLSLDELYKPGAQKTTINGHEGWSYTEDGLHYFGYVNGENGILVGSDNQTMLDEVII